MQQSFCQIYRKGGFLGLATGLLDIVLQADQAEIGIFIIRFYQSEASLIVTIPLMLLNPYCLQFY